MNVAAFTMRTCGLVCALMWAHDARGAERPYRNPTQVRWNGTTNRFVIVEAGTRTRVEMSTADGTLSAPTESPRSSLISSSGFAFPSPDGRWTALIDPWQPRLLVCAGVEAELPQLPREKCREIEIASNPQALAIAPDGRTVVVACDPAGTGDRVVCVVDVASGGVKCRPIPGSSNLRGVAIDPTGKFALAVHLRPKFRIPSTQIEQGWVFTNAISLVLLTDDAPVVTLPLDTRTEGFANPEGIVIDAAGKRAYVAHAGADIVSVIDLPALRRVADRAAQAGVDRPDSGSRGDDLRLTREYVRARIAVESNPCGISLSADGRWLAVTNRLADSVSLIDCERLQVARTVKLSDTEPDLVRRGEITFHSGKLSFAGQFSCASCHPDGHADGLNWDLPADGFNNFHNTKSLLGAAGTEPYGWLGESPTLPERFTGTLRHLFQFEPDGETTAALAAYLAQLDYPRDIPQREAADSAAVLRGRDLFAGSAGCSECHQGPQLTDRQPHAVESGDAAYDTPSLLHVSETAPYLHDGRAAGLKDIFAVHNRAGRHGHADRLTPSELDELVAYLRSLR